MSPHWFRKFCDCHLNLLVNRLVVDSTCRIQRNSIIETPETQHTTAAFSSKEQGNITQHNNRTNTSSASCSPTKYHNRLLLHMLLYSCSAWLGCAVHERVSWLVADARSCRCTFSRSASPCSPALAVPGVASGVPVLR